VATTTQRPEHVQFAVEGVTRGYDKEGLRTRLHRVQGQVRGVERMVDEDRSCIDILTQVAAAKTALESFALELVSGHVRHCVSDALGSGDEEAAAAKSEELLAAVERFAKTA
jgi:DNA-binding FrmR family transcriptional regulator